MTDIKQRFGKHVAEYRKRRGLTQDALAVASDLSVDMVKRLEAGRIGASFDAVGRLADALNIDVGKLFVQEEGGSRRVLDRLVFELSSMTDEELAWLSTVIEAVRRRP